MLIPVSMVLKTDTTYVSKTQYITARLLTLQFSLAFTACSYSLCGMVPQDTGHQTSDLQIASSIPSRSAVKQ